ncbi:MBL fold metallo-hydrolase [uncultured Croceitalea sp.]|uniref:MBL fold metallo-hydrolase n=1 Tax=uncultured Croceitalea sp. TaxID=1798908 RepID=UPI003305FE8A
MVWTFLGAILFIIVGYLLFVNFYPSFGGDLTDASRTRYESSPNFKEGKFVNTDSSIPKQFSFSETLSLSRKFFFTKVPNGRPDSAIDVKTVDSIAIANYQGPTRLIWFGHSAFLLQIKGRNLLIDPMFGKVAAPHDLLGSSRFNTKMPIAIEKLPQIDAILISHDHYDHLDYESIKKLKAKVKHYYTPLGVGIHLEAWGIPKSQITELDWWQDIAVQDLKFICTPAQHFSGRKFDSGQSTLWSSWIIQSRDDNIFFSGDSGYAPHFKKIGDSYGPFDFAMLECGQYNKMWPEIHMFPEETVQAAVDLKTNVMMPIHWGGFKLALHSWTDPVERVSKKARELQIPLITPEIGTPIVLNSILESHNEWWLK